MGKKRVEELNRQEQESKASDIQFTLSLSKKMKFGNSRLYNGGFIFLSKIYRQLGLSGLCKKISRKYRFKFNLDSILSRLVYSTVRKETERFSLGMVSR